MPPSSFALLQVQKVLPKASWLGTQNSSWCSVPTCVCEKAVFLPDKADERRRAEALVLGPVCHAVQAWWGREFEGLWVGH